MISHGDNFRLVTGDEAATSLQAYMATLDLEPSSPRVLTRLPTGARPENDSKRWTPADVESLRNMWKFSTDEELAVLFSRTATAITAKRTLLGLTGPSWR